MPISQLKKQQSVREQVGEKEWQTRVDLAACYRLMHEYGMVEMIANHISARVPDTDGQFLINPYGMLYEEITASSLIKIDIDGNILFNATDYDVNKAGYVIHSAICNAKIQLPPHEVVKQTQDGFKPGVRRRWGLLEWPALLRKLDKTDASYRD